MWRRELLDSPEVLKIIVESVPTIVLVLDEQGRIAKVNNYFERKTGYAAETVLGKDWFAMFLPEAERLEIREVFAQVMEQGTNPGHVNNILTAEGKLLSIEWFAKVIADPEQRTRWLLNVGHDITERLEYERALEDKRQEAVRANATKTRFLAAASHDLRQPLQTLVILNEGLVRVASNGQQREMLKMQKDALHGMRDLLNALLDIGKLEAGAIKPEIRAFRVSDVFDVLRSELEPLAVQQGLRLVVDQSEDTARSDPTLLMQLLQNLVGNAIRYTSRGSVRLTSKALGEWLEISVIDTGIGIASDQHELIFDEFYQVDAQERAGGLGLGLSIVKRIAELLGCEIGLESKLGNGTTFRLRVPAADEVIAPEQPQREPRPRKGRVLLVDDDAGVLAASKLLLGIDGFTVIAAASPDEAEIQLESSTEPFDIVITDYHLHDQRTGWDIVSAVRERQGRAVPAIILTGDTSPKIVNADLPCLEVLSKPVQPDHLFATVQRLLDDAR